ncbi:MAG: Clp protease N-terminal domain-containing protein [Verrucomicrobiota bacterium]
MQTRDDTTSSWFDWAAKHLEDWKAQEDAWRHVFTSDALGAIEYARLTACSMKHEYVGAEHLLAGLLKSDYGMVPTLLRTSGVDVPTLEHEMEAAGSKTLDPDARWPRCATPRFSRIIAGAKEEAAIHGNGRVGSGHLFLALLREPDGLPASIFRKYHIDLERIRQAILEEIKP